MGCRQVVRHQGLVLAFGGSNPSIPAMKKEGHRTFFFHGLSDLNPRIFCLAKVGGFGVA